MRRPLALPQRSAFLGIGYSSLKEVDAVYTRKYNCCPRYCRAQNSDLKFHIPTLSRATYMAVHDLGYTCTHQLHNTLNFFPTFYYFFATKYSYILHICVCVCKYYLNSATGNCITEIVLVPTILCPLTSIHSEGKKRTLKDRPKTQHGDP